MTATTQPFERALLVTGTDTGIGAAIARMATERGLTVIAPLGPQDGPVPFTHENLRVRRGNLGDPAFVSNVLEGIRWVIHTVFDCRPRAGYDELAATHLNVSRHLFEAASEAGCDSFVHVSRARICATSDKYIDEESEIRPHNPCEQTLYDTEVLLSGLANRQAGGTRLSILRSAPVYGYEQPPSSSPWLALPPLLGLYFELVPGVAGGPRCHFVHVEDVAGAALHLMSYESESPVETFHVADDTPLTIGEFFNCVIEAYGLTLGVKVPFPNPALVRMLLPVVEQPLVLSAADAALSRLWRLTLGGRDDGPDYTPSLQQSSFTELFEEAFFNNDRLKATGYTLKHPDVRTSLGEVVARYQRQGYLPEGRVEQAPTESEHPLVGTLFGESLKGTFTHGDAPQIERSLQLDVTMTSTGLHIPFRDHLWNLDGRIDAEGMATDASVSGTLDLSLFGKKRLTYEFGFTGDDGERYRVVGLKTIRFRDIAKSLTQMEIHILDASGSEVAAGVMRFDLRRELLNFLRSFRVELG